MKGFIDLVGVGAGINNEREINEIASYLLHGAGIYIPKWLQCNMQLQMIKIGT